MLLPIVLLWLLSSADASAFTSGSIVVFRLGDNITSFQSTTIRVSLLEINPSTGAVLQTIAIPSNPTEATATGLSMFTNIGTSSAATPIGFFNLAFNKKYLVATATALAAGSSVSASSPRVIMRIDGAGNIDTLTTYTYSVGGTRNVVSVDGSEFWLALGSAGTAAVAHVPLGTGTGSQAATTLVAFSGGRVLGVCDEAQLYLGGTGVIMKVGSSPLSSNTGQTTTTAISLASSALPDQMVFIDRVSAVDGADSLYFTDEVAGGSGVYKYYKASSSSSVWTAAGTYPPNTGSAAYRGLCGSEVDGKVVLYVTRSNNEVVKITDTAAYNAAFSGAEVLLYKQLGLYSLRGISFSPAVSECPYAYRQTGYVVSGCNATSIAAGTTCSAVCDTANSYSGTVSGTVTCPTAGGVYSGTFSGCVFIQPTQPTPTAQPTSKPTTQPTPTAQPTSKPTPQPTPTAQPTSEPTTQPTNAPSSAPSTPPTAGASLAVEANVLSAGEIAAIAAPVLLLIVLCLVGFAVWRHRKSKAKKPDGGKEMTPME